MIGVVLYTLIEYANYYLAYRNVLGIRFTKKKLPYLVVIVSTCMVQIAVWCLVDHTWRDVIPVPMGLLGAIILTESKKWRTFLLYPMAVFFPSLINMMASYGVAAIWGITQEAVCNSVALTLLSESTAILLLIIYDVVLKKRVRKESSLTVGQCVILLVGAIGFFIIIGYSQGLINGDIEFIADMRDEVAIAGVVMALFFFSLSIWQQITWKKAIRYQKENEKYEVFLAGQEEHIRMLILEDENRRKLRHDMNAHMLALSTMAEREEWDQLKRYLQQMKESIEDGAVTKYTNISAVDAIVEEWHGMALKYHAEWVWEGTLKYTDRVTVFELCTIFSNLLSNAVEAIEKTEEGARIEIKILQFQEKITLFVGNTCSQNLTVQERPMTTKGDRIYHGLGLKNVEEIVNKHQGKITYKIENGWFQVKLVL